MLLTVVIGFVVVLDEELIVVVAEELFVVVVAPSVDVVLLEQTYKSGER